MSDELQGELGPDLPGMQELYQTARARYPQMTNQEYADYCVAMAQLYRANIMGQG
jgi:hypothetical protein